MPCEAASPSSVTAVIPYFSYAKGKADKRGTGTDPGTGVRRRHRGSRRQPGGDARPSHATKSGFFKVPVDDLYALPVMCEAIAAKGLPDLVVVSPDAGFVKEARQWSERLNAPLAIADKRRTDHSESAEVLELMGSVDGRTALIVDDFTISGGTLVDAARLLIERGAVSVYAAVTHGLLTGTAISRLDDSPIERLFMTDSIETHPNPLPAKVEVVSVAGLFGEAIHRIARRESISVLFS